MSVHLPFTVQKDAFNVSAQQVVATGDDTCRVEVGGTQADFPIDNLYLDCNGIVHPCCHPEDGQPQPANEDEMLEVSSYDCHNSSAFYDMIIMQNVGALITKLVMITRPRNMLYLALDGVAPRAKMNQQARNYAIQRNRCSCFTPCDSIKCIQRARRFCSARDAAEAEAEAMMTGGAAAAPRWDHNVITPGTPFMAKLASYLRRFVAERQRYGGAVWQRLAVVVDDSSSPVIKGA